MVADFCCPDAWLIVGLDGGQHGEDGASRRDGARTAELEAFGYHVVRFWNGDILGNLDGVCETILSTARGLRAID